MQKLDASADQITLQFGPEFARLAPVDPIRIIDLIQKNRSNWPDRIKSRFFAIVRP